MYINGVEIHLALNFLVCHKIWGRLLPNRGLQPLPLCFSCCWSDKPPDATLWKAQWL